METEIIRASREEDNLDYWKLTPMDRMVLSKVLCGTWVFNAQLDIEHMKKCLADLLNFYPHLAGRMEKGKQICLNNKGVPLTICSTPTISSKDLLQNQETASAFSTPLNMARIKKGRDAPVSFRITKLKDAMVLGVNCIHGCLDGNSFYTMIYNWGCLCTGKPFPAPLLDQARLPASTNRSPSELKASARQMGWKRLSIIGLLKTMPFLSSKKMYKRLQAVYLPGEEINRLKQTLSQKAACDLSNNDVICAWIIKLLSKVQGMADHIRQTPVIVLDIRGRMNGIPECFAGNAAGFIKVKDFPAKTEVEEIAQIIHHDMAPFLKENASELEKFMSFVCDFIQKVKTITPFNIDELYGPNPTVYYINSFTKYPIYDVDFGSMDKAVTPAAVIPHNVADPIMIWPAPPEKGGIEVYFTGRMAIAWEAYSRKEPLVNMPYLLQKN